jgi:hypothetical protein
VRLFLVYRVDVSVNDDEIHIIGANHRSAAKCHQKQKQPVHWPRCFHIIELPVGEADSFLQNLQINIDFFQA